MPFICDNNNQKIKTMKIPTAILILLFCILSSCAPRIVRDNTIQIRPEYIRLHYNVDTRHIHVISNPPGVDVSFETDELWIILPDMRSVTTPGHVNITVDPNMTPGWRTGYVRFHSHGFDGAVLEITQMSESVLINNPILQTNNYRQTATRKSVRAWKTDTIRATIHQPVSSGNFADQH